MFRFALGLFGRTLFDFSIGFEDDHDDLELPIPLPPMMPMLPPFPGRPAPCDCADCRPKPTSAEGPPPPPAPRPVRGFTAPEKK